MNNKIFEFFKRFISTLLLTVLCIFISGCLDIEYRIDIKRDGKENITVKVGMPVNLSSGVGDLIKSLEENGFKVTYEIDRDRYYVIGKQTAPKGILILPYPMNLVRDKPKLENRYFDFLVVKKYSIKAQYILDKDKVFSIFQNNVIPMRYIISVPGKFVQNNADKISTNTMTWKYLIRPDEKIDINFTSYDINYLAVIIILLILGVFAIQIWRKKSPTNIINKVSLKQVNRIDKDTLIEVKDEKNAVGKLQEDRKKNKPMVIIIFLLCIIIYNIGKLVFYPFVIKKAMPQKSQDEKMMMNRMFKDAKPQKVVNANQKVRKDVGYILEGIYFDSQKDEGSALINGNVFFAGDSIGNIKIEGINKHSIDIIINSQKKRLEIGQSINESKK